MQLLTYTAFVMMYRSYCVCSPVTVLMPYGSGIFLSRTLKHQLLVFHSTTVLYISKFSSVKLFMKFFSYVNIFIACTRDTHAFH